METRLSLLAAAQAQEAANESQEIVVSAQKNNETQVIQGGQVGVLGDKDGLDVPFNIRSYSAALIQNQQSETLGQVLENDPSVRTTLGFGNSSEQFVIRGFPLYGDDVSIDGLYGVTPRQLVSPGLYDSVQILNGASAFLNGAAPGGSGTSAAASIWCSSGPAIRRRPGYRRVPGRQHLRRQRRCRPPLRRERRIRRAPEHDGA